MKKTLNSLLAIAALAFAACIAAPASAAPPGDSPVMQSYVNTVSQPAAVAPIAEVAPMQAEHFAMDSSQDVLTGSKAPAKKEPMKKGGGKKKVLAAGPGDDDGGGGEGQAAMRRMLT